MPCWLPRKRLRRSIPGWLCRVSRRGVSALSRAKVRPCKERSDELRMRHFLFCFEATHYRRYSILTRRFALRSTCPEGCQMNWTEVFNAVNDEDSGTGTAGNNGGGNTAALESGGGMGAGVMGAGIGVGICAIVGVGAFVLRRRRMEARFQEVVKMVEDDERGGELRMQRRGDDFNKFKI